MHPEVKRNGVGTQVGIAVSILTLLPPVVTQLVALVENTAAHWTTADKTSLIVGGVTAVATIAGKFAQAVAAIIKGK